MQKARRSSPGWGAAFRISNRAKLRAPRHRCPRWRGAHSITCGLLQVLPPRDSLPDPTDRPADFVDFVLNEASSSPGELIVPITDVTTMLLLTDGRLGSRLVAPSLNSYEALSDKQRLLQLAASLGIPTPETVVANSIASAVAATEALGFPVVVKPARSRYLRAGRVGSTSVSIAHDMPSAHRILSGAEWLKDIPALVQRYIPGRGAGVFGLAKSGRPIAWFSHQRLREKPPSGGLSVLSESMPANHKLVEMSAQLLGAVDSTGVTMVEYRITPDGEPFLMEVNGRFWGSLQLSVDAGIDFPWLLYQLTIGEQILEAQEYMARHPTALGPWRFGQSAHSNSRSETVPKLEAAMHGDRRIRQRVPQPTFAI